MNSTSSFIYNVLEWITRFAYLNLLWVLFSLVGGVIFGIFPATIAMFAITREWLMGNTDGPLFKSFWGHYRENFIKGNVLGLFVAVIICLITMDIFYIQANNNELLTWTYIPLFAFMLLFILFLFYLYPTFVHYDLKLPQVIKNSFLIMLINPIHSLLILMCLVPLFFIMRAFPALAFIFGGSSYAYITMWLSLHAFNRLNRKNQTQNVQPFQKQ